LFHDQLRALFADGLDDAVCVLARDVIGAGFSYG
jgi:hypothetical protein